ncbi:sensor histidine kinase [Marinicella rhabdoformis]|uniref:sensor histidine kinase n=1 Tax=Marinicella rhabdoformis TaxID=2580566 RepID=UPI0012AED4D0|nr:ATP-binding protein [Marinicella rhabdoformis]
MLNDQDKIKFHKLERRNLQILNLFRLFVALYFFALAHNSSFNAFHEITTFHHNVNLTVAFYIVCALMVAVISYVSSQVDATRISKFTLFVDLFVMIYMAYATNGISQGLAILPVLVIGSSSILYRRAANILLAPTLASILLLTMPSMVSFASLDDITQSSKLLHILAYFVIALLGIRQSMSYTSTLSMYRAQSKTISGLENLNQIIIEKLSQGVVIYQNDHVIVHANQTAKELLNIDDDIFLPQDVIEVIENNADGQVYQNADNNNLYLRPALIDEEQNIHLLFIEDSSFLKKAAQQLNLASLGKMSSSIAHEIRNPLAAINTASELLIESPDLKEQDKEISQIIVNNVLRANSIIEDILQMSRRSTADPKDLLIKALLEEIKSDMVMQKQATITQIEIEMDDTDKTISFDSKHIKQILWNLTTNALKHGEDGILKIKVKDQHIDFMNKGKAFDEEKINNLFEPFFTTHSRGTGLGLHICRELCHDNHAKLNYLYDEPYHMFRLTFNLSK